MGIRTILGAALVAFPGAAHADMTAVYGTPNTPMKMTVEVASNGDMHATMMTGNMAILMRGGHGYVIFHDQSGTSVSRVEDVATVTAEHLARIEPQLRAAAKQAKPTKLVRKGTATINGRSGDAYYWQVEGGSLSARPVLVMNHDPALAPLGRAVATEFALTMRFSANILPGNVFQPLLAALRTGTPLLITGSELQTIADAPVAASEFALPKPPQTLDQLRARMANGGLKSSG